MITYPSISFKELIQRVQKMGFQKIRQKGSHIRFEHLDGRKITIPDHGGKDVPKGLLNKLIRYDLEMIQEDFWSSD